MRRTPRFFGRLVLTVAVASTTLAVAMAPAHADTPYTPWSGYLTGWTTQFVPTSANDCVAGRPNCLKATLKELGRIFDSTAHGCDHNAPFAMAYLRMTQTYGWSRDVPGYYQDVPFANHQDAVFARYYTDAFDHYQAGNRAAVPNAWLTAFDAAASHEVSGTGDLMLGMNAHINRDLPFVVAAVGLIAPDGSSRKPDYDKVEQWLNSATAPLLAEASARFDAGMDDSTDPNGLSYYTLFQMVSGWRENAWRNAEALVSATTPLQRALVETRIENDANTIAAGLKASFAYNAVTGGTAARDSFCATHHDSLAPQPYDFGQAAAYGYTY